MLDALARAFGPMDDRAVAHVSVLFQAMDATAALVAAALVDHLGPPDGGAHPATPVPPIMLTTRTLATRCRIGDVTVPAGAPVVVHLGAATIATATPRAATGFTFGLGPHACPGVDVATATAGGIVDAVAGRRVAWAEPGRPLTYEGRPNLRLPTSLPRRGQRIEIARSGQRVTAAPTASSCSAGTSSTSTVA